MSRALTARQWRALAGRVAERAAGCGSVPSVEARMVLLGILSRFSRGETLPAQRAFAAELGLSERSLRRRLAELTELGLALLVQRGSRPAGYELDVAAVRSWAGGGEIEGADDRPIWPGEAANLAGQGGVVDCNYGRATRARASSSSSSVPSESDGQDGPSTLDEAIVRLQWFGFPTSSPAMKATVGRWLEEFSVQDIGWAAEQSFDHGKRTVAYMNSVLRGLQVDRAAEAARREGGVVAFDEYRGMRPWSGGTEPE